MGRKQEDKMNFDGKMNDQSEAEFTKIVNGWRYHGDGRAITQHPLFKWEQGMKRDRNGNPDLNDVITVALLAEQARRFNESADTRRRGGYVTVRDDYRRSKMWTDNVPVVYVAPIATGWKVKNLDADDVEHGVVAAIVFQTEGQAWACAWLLAAHDVVIREGGYYNGVERDGLARSAVCPFLTLSGGILDKARPPVVEASQRQRPRWSPSGGQDVFDEVCTRRECPLRRARSA